MSKATVLKRRRKVEKARRHHQYDQRTAYERQTVQAVIMDELDHMIRNVRDTLVSHE